MEISEKDPGGMKYRERCQELSTGRSSSYDGSVPLLRCLWGLILGADGAERTKEETGRQLGRRKANMFAFISVLWLPRKEVGTFRASSCMFPPSVAQI